jgi:NAD(P)-dependent dehydrogenase (short-subunit alcohol dehydrogenase family)
MDAESRVAIITGASQGIGAGLVRGFREHGFRVVANSRSIKPDAFADLDVLAVAGDIADPRTAERVVPAAMAALTKGGLDAVIRALAIEYAGRGIRVNAVAPGIIKTPMHPAESHESLARLHPVGRMGEVRKVVDAVLYLESAAFVTGEVLHVDGGQHAGRW